MSERANLYQHMNAKVAISPTEFDAFAAAFKPISITKKQILLQAGKPNDKLYFVEKGLLFSYKELDNGDTQVIQFAKENHWISDLYSFLSGARALFSVQALEDTSVWALSKTDLDAICQQHRQMETYYSLNMQNGYVNTLLRLSNAYSTDAAAKYDELRDKQPDLLQRVPQYLIASYLGILPSSLSRIRNKKTDK